MTVTVGSTWESHAITNTKGAWNAGIFEASDGDWYVLGLTGLPSGPWGLQMYRSADEGATWALWTTIASAIHEDFPYCSQNGDLLYTFNLTTTEARVWRYNIGTQTNIGVTQIEAAGVNVVTTGRRFCSGAHADGDVFSCYALNQYKFMGVDTDAVSYGYSTDAGASWTTGLVHAQDGNEYRGGCVIPITSGGRKHFIFERVDTKELYHNFLNSSNSIGTAAGLSITLDEGIFDARCEGGHITTNGTVRARFAVMDGSFSPEMEIYGFDDADTPTVTLKHTLTMGGIWGGAELVMDDDSDRYLFVYGKQIGFDSVYRIIDVDGAGADTVGSETAISTEDDLGNCASILQLDVGDTILAVVRQKGTSSSDTRYDEVTLAVAAATLTPDPISATFSIPTPKVTMTRPVGFIGAIFSIPIPEAPRTQKPSADTATFALPTPTVNASNIRQPSPVSASLTSVEPVLDLTIPIEPEQINFAILAPTVIQGDPSAVGGGLIPRRRRRM